jgi:diguanylate cyclase (GGDEF)-like protein/PAS domain S-box-containing protein
MQEADRGQSVLEQAPTPRSAAPSPRRRNRTEWIVWALAWVVCLALVTHAIWRARAQTIAQDLDRLQAQAQAVELHLVRQLQAASDVLTGTRSLLADELDHSPRLSPRMKVLVDAMPGVSALQFANEHGRIMAASRHELVGRDVSQRAHFVNTRDAGPDGGLLLTPPFRSALNQFTTALSRGVFEEDGSFSGVVSATLDLEYFEIVLRAVLYASDAQATIVHGAGTVIVSSPLDTARPGLNLNLPGFTFRQHLDSGQTQTVQEGAIVDDDQPRLVAMRSVSPSALRLDHPFIVRMTRRTDAVLASWRAQARNELLLTLAALGISAVWLRWHQGRRHLLEKTERAAAQAERESARRLEFGLRGADLGLWEWNLADDSVTVNDREMDILGYPPTDQPLRGEFWRAQLHADDVAQTDQAVAAHLRGETPSYRLEHRLRHRDGHWIWVQTHAVVMQRSASGQAQRVVGTHLDITERKRSQLELERMNAQLAALSLTDGLTGVANRRHFDQNLPLEWSRALRTHQSLTLLMLDVDHFKLYNDSLGHPEGDACLRAVAQVLASCVRHPVEKIARYGGEEFALLLVDADESAGVRVAQRCLQSMRLARLPHPCSPVGPWVSISIGVASMRPDATRSPDQLVLAADAALYRAKQQGRDRYALATPADAQRRAAPSGMAPLTA